MPAFQIQIIRLHVARVSARECGLLMSQGGCQCADDRRRDLILYREKVLEIAIEALGPELIAIGDIDELHRDAYSIRCTSDAALEYRFNIQFPADFANVQRAIPK